MQILEGITAGLEERKSYQTPTHNFQDPKIKKINLVSPKIKILNINKNPNIDAETLFIFFQFIFSNFKNSLTEL
jgi:hypothetical protein